jgi:hypothetical protein
VCPTKGNDSYSVSANHSDWKGYQGYLVKHEDTTILHCNYDVEEIKSYYESQAAKSDKFKRRTEYTKIYNFVMANLNTDRPDPRMITKLIMKFYLEEQKIFNKAHIAQILNTIWYNINDQDESFIESVLEEANIRSQWGKKIVTKCTSYYQDPE